jgi:AP-1 complex subunit mu
MAASALFILDLKGRVILSRDYRGDVPLKFAERFVVK